MRKSEYTFEEPTRQSIVAIILIIFNYLKIIVRQIWPLLFILFLGNRSSQKQFWITIGLGGIGLFAMIRAIIAYFRFYFYIENEELIIEKGILKRTRLSVPFDRIQTVNISQNIIHQALNVVKLEVDTAGSKSTEFQLDALSKDQAEALRYLLLERKRSKLSQSKDYENGEEEHKELVLHLSPWDLLKVGITQNHLKSAGIIFIFLVSIQNSLEDIGLEAENDIEGYVREGLQSGVTIFMILVVLVGVISFVLSLFRTVLTYYDLSLWRQAGQYKMVSGLLNRKERSILDSKIQQIHWHDNILQKMIGLFEVRLMQAGSTEIGKSSSISIPGCFQHQIEFLKDNWLGKKNVESLHKTPLTKHYLYRRLLYRLIFALIGIGAAIILENVLWMVLFGLLTLYFIVSSIFAYRKAGYAVNHAVLWVSKGVFGDSYGILPLYKIQNLQITQSFYQQRHQLANLHVYTAASKLVIPYIPYETARSLSDYLLYSVQSSNKAWM